MSTDLKPCPFCDSEVKLRDYHGRYSIYCPSCEYEWDLIEARSFELDQNIRRWNKRVVESKDLHLNGYPRYKDGSLVILGDRIQKNDNVIEVASIEVDLRERYIIHGTNNECLMGEFGSPVLRAGEFY